MQWLLAEAPKEARATVPAALEATLESMLAATRSAWPNIELSDKDFLIALGRHLSSMAGLGHVRTSDLYLAVAALAGDRHAVGSFDTMLRGECQRAAKRSNGQLEASDLFSSLRVRLLFAPGSLREFSGQGSLKGWLGVVVVRAQLNAARSKRRAEGRERIATGAGETESFANPELELMRAKYRGAFNDAFRAALASLDERERGLLRLNVVEGLGLDRLARLKNVGRSTAARWLAAVRQQLLDETRTQLIARLGVGESTLDSLLPLLKSDLDVSLRMLLDSSS